MRTAAQVFYLAVFSLLGASHAGTHAAATKSKSAPANVCDVSKDPSCAPAQARGESTKTVFQLEPGAIVSDACASYNTLEQLNEAVQPYLQTITQKTDFFSHYRLSLYSKKCPFWDDENGMCGNVACAVNTLENEEDIPLVWRAKELGKLEGPTAQHPGKKQQKEERKRPLHGGLGEDVDESCVVEYDDECDERDYCVPDDESATAKGDYVSLVDNPERFTGYAGVGAQQVWEAIYRENCFSKPPKVAQSSGQSAQSAADVGGEPAAQCHQGTGCPAESPVSNRSWQAPGAPRSYRIRRHLSGEACVPPCDIGHACIHLDASVLGLSQPDNRSMGPQPYLL
jgi:ERO1-like protein beta